MKSFVAHPAERIRGHIKVPGDKSISHRAIMLGAIASGRTEVRGFLPGEDCLATLKAVEAMGMRVTRHADTAIDIHGKGLAGLRAASQTLDMGNSGTAMRLFAGLLSGQAFDATLVGDESLSRRPMERVAQPLRQMGARIETTDGHPPLRVSGGQRLHGIRHEMSVASAQVKSAILLAGLYAEGETSIRELAATRDHTERMLATFGQPVVQDGDLVRLVPTGALQGCSVAVPGDISSAAFMLLAGSLAREGELVIEQVGLNPSRTGILGIFRSMGVDLQVETAPESFGREPVGRITVRPSSLHGVVISPELVPLAIDEFPIVFVAAGLAEGDTIITGAAELRHKESDRIAVMAAGLRSLGVRVEELPDGARIRGGGLNGGEIDSRGDHRIAMAFAIGAMRAKEPVRILDTANVATSFPGFVELVNAVGMHLEEYTDGQPHGTR